ncbi:MAG: hypothetical protein VX223_02205 [Myxococcota bacterium]|nr:hypothetical protein [Myxococcota bacterium]
MNEYHYAAWIVFDLRLLIFVALISLFLAIGTVALLFKGKQWHDYLTAFISLFVTIFVVTIVIFNGLANYPVFLIEDIFPFP